MLKLRAGLRSGIRHFARWQTTSANAAVANSASSITEHKITIEEPQQESELKIEKTDAFRNRGFSNIRFQPQSRLYNDPLLSRMIPELEATRIIPTMSTFYAKNPYHESNIGKIMDLLNKNATLPFDRKSARTSWLQFSEYREKAGGNLLKQTEYEQLIKLLKRLDAIDPELRSEELDELLTVYASSKNSTHENRKVKTLDADGKAIAIGRRKSSSAKAYVVKGEGLILINGKNFDEVFPKLQDRLRVLYPLQLVEAESSFNIFAKVRGGGSTGQIDSLRLAISKALCIHNPLFKQRLSGAGCLHRDPRAVERKKPGKKKARKMPTWVKR